MWVWCEKLSSKFQSTCCYAVANLDVEVTGGEVGEVRGWATLESNLGAGVRGRST